MLRCLSRLRAQAPPVLGNCDCSRKCIALWRDDPVVITGVQHAAQRSAKTANKTNWLMTGKPDGIKSGLDGLNSILAQRKGLRIASLGSRHNPECIPPTGTGDWLLYYCGTPE